MSENYNATVGGRNWYEMENERLKQQLATVIEQRDRAWAAFLDAYQHHCCSESMVALEQSHAQAIAEARENGDSGN